MRSVCYLLIWSQTCCNLLPSPRLCPRRSPTSESGSPGPLAPCISEPIQETAHTYLLRGRDPSFLSAESRRVILFGRERFDVPARNCQSGPIWQRGLALAEGAGMLLSPSAAPLFSGGLPRLETIKCCFSVRMWQQVGPRMKPLPTQSFHPCRPCPNCVVP